MPFDPNKPYEKDEVKKGFDPNRPFEVEPPPSEIESFGRGAIQTGSFGFADEIEARARTILDAEKYNPVRDAIRQKYKRSQAANPNAYLAGELTGGAASTMIPYVGQLGRGATVGARIGGAAAQGAAGGLGSSEAEDTGGQASDTFWGGLTGGVFGLGADVISKIPGRVRNFAADRASAQLGAERQTIKSIGAPRVREAGRIALDKNIIDPSTEVMQSRMKDLAKESGEKIGSIYSTIDENVPMSFSPKEVSAEFAKEHGGFYQSPLNKDVTNLYDNLIETVSAGGAETVPLSQAQEMKQILARAAKFNSPSRDQDPKALMAGEAYHIVSKHLNSAVEKGGESLGKTDLIAELAAANREYAASKAMKKMLTNRYAREQGNKMGTGLTDSIFMAEAANIAAQGQPMKAAGMYGAKKAYEKYGNYGMAKGADVIADILEKAPQSLGKYAPMMMNAARQGPQSLAVQHYVMSQRDPEYAGAIQQAIDDSEKKKIELPIPKPLGEQFGDIIDQSMWTDKVGLDPQEKTQNYFEYGEGVPQPAMAFPFKKGIKPKIFNDLSYRGSHAAPIRKHVGEGSAPIHSLEMIYPSDIYSSKAKQYYGHGVDYDNESINVLQSVRGKPDAKVTVYRSVPYEKGAIKHSLNDGDWVTPSFEYAKYHGENKFGSDYRIIRKTVKADDLFTDGNSIHEWGYDPK